MADATKAGRDRTAASWVRDLSRSLDPDGVPLRWPVEAWGRALAAMAEGRRSDSSGWPEALDARAEGLVRATLRFTRPDGTPVFGPTGPGAVADPRALLDWSRWLSDPGLESVIRRWFPGMGRPGFAPPPLPADARPDRPLAMLRADWSRQGDLLAIDHREPGDSASVELYGLGRPWLGPSWSLEIEGRTEPRAGRSRPLAWYSTSTADLAEWTFRAGRFRVVRTAVLLRGRRLALLADQVDGPASASATMRVGLADGVAARPIAESRGLALSGEGARSTLRVFPIGLPRRPYPTDRGALSFESGGMTLRHRAEGRRCWLPMLVSWEPARNRLPTHWRPLTVSESSRVCPPDVAFAARVTWGRHETLVIYRSLARPAARALLGHQTRARFLIALFAHETGDMTPLLKIEG